MKHLRACVRLQFHRDFAFDHAIPFLDYFAALGISHIYASPILKARSGSLHGYDVVDPNQVNPELGGEPGLQRFVQALRERGMGIIVDFVPNHMAVGGSENPWWQDVLQWGMRSPYAQFFDVQWDSADPLLNGQVLVPFLSKDYGEALRCGEIQLRFDVAEGCFFAEHYDHHFPICPVTYKQILDLTQHHALTDLAWRFGQLSDDADYWSKAKQLQKALGTAVSEHNLSEVIELAMSKYNVPLGHADRERECFDQEINDCAQKMQRMHQLLELQNYRLASWRAAADDLNWRRFFDINELAGLRMEQTEVFNAVHEKLFELIGRGLIDGLRIDHIDGLADPRAYCNQLRERVNGLLQQRPMLLRSAHFPIYVEKILAGDEQLTTHWRVYGTTGYEFMNQVSLLQHDPAGAEPLTQHWQEVSGRNLDFREEIIEARRLVLSSSLAGDFETVAQGLLEIARADISTRDYTLAAIRRVLLEIIAHFSIYRIYASIYPLTAQDEQYFAKALDGARGTLIESDGPLLDQLALWLGREPLYQLPPDATRDLRRKTLARFQQLTSAAAAKAVEDTACYRSAALLSRNDVGFDPCQWSSSVEHFHSLCKTRADTFPYNLLTTATHDHKRGEDTRARLAVISEKSAWFIAQVADWRSLAQAWREELEDGPAPSPGDELILYQTLLASWPFELSPHDVAGQAMDSYLERLTAWQEKALREAKLRTHWSSPNQAYETVCSQFLTALLREERTSALRSRIANAAMMLAPAGAINGLTQCLLRMTTPGVPDLYQGTEFWDFSLVDPDNRRPVDFSQRIATLNPSASVDELINSWRDGRIKQYVIYKTLNYRRELPELFSEGEYCAVEVEGQRANHLVAFLRVYGTKVILVVAPRLTADLLGAAEIPLIPADAWQDTKLRLPSIGSVDTGARLDISSVTDWQSLFTPNLINDPQMLVRDLLKDFPVNVFVGHIPLK